MFTLNMVRMYNKVLDIGSTRLPRISYYNLVESDHLWYKEVKVFTHLLISQALF